MVYFAIFVAPPRTLSQLSSTPTTPTKRSFVDCINPELTKTDPCCICDQPVHHLCSNDLYDPGNIAVRFCSSTCVAEWKSKDLMVTNAADNRITFKTMGWSTDSSCQQASQTASSGSTEPFFSQNSDATLPPDTLACVDSYGIPLDIHHSRQLGKRDNIWDVAHVLAAPYSIGSPTSASFVRQTQPVSPTRPATRGKLDFAGGATRPTSRSTWLQCMDRNPSAWLK
eukprot:jgi/Phyca11/100869/e_gw1.5.932.1